MNISTMPVCFSPVLIVNVLEMPMDKKSPPTSPLRQCFEKLQTTTATLDDEWQQRAEEELNETPENFKQRTNALRLQVLSK